MKPFDPNSPSPLYHQIAEAIRSRIAVGELPAGVALPPLRAAAAEWGVNLHTVRHAYAELARQGLVSTEAPYGTRVLAVAQPLPDLQEFVERTVREGQERFGLGPAELSAAIASFSVETAPAPVVWVVECSDAQCADLAEQLAARFAVDARPWCLHQSGEPAAGPIVATYFHYGEVRRRWPHRSADVSFASIHPDPALIVQVEALNAGTTLTVCERDQPTADAIAADLSVLFPGPRWTLTTRVWSPTDDPPSAGAPLLFPPRVWAALSSVDRVRPGVLHARYLFDGNELDTLGRRLAWPRKRGSDR